MADPQSDADEMSAKKILMAAPFSVLAAATVLGYGVVEWGGQHVSGVAPGSFFADIVRLLIVPMWLVRFWSVTILVSAFGDPQAIPQWLAIATVPLIFLPYMAADLLLRVIRNQTIRPTRGSA